MTNTENQTTADQFVDLWHSRLRECADALDALDPLDAGGDSRVEENNHRSSMRTYQRLILRAVRPRH